MLGGLCWSLQGKPECMTRQLGGHNTDLVGDYFNHFIRGSLRGVMRQRSEFELQSLYYVHFLTNSPWERHEHPYPLDYELDSTLFFSKDCFGIK